MTDNTKIKYISLTVIKRLLIYAAISVCGAIILNDEATSIRNSVYGIGNYINSRALTGMLAALNIIFLFVLVLFLFTTRRRLYTAENRASDKLGQYVKFETLLEASITIGYVAITALALFWVRNAGASAGLAVPIYCMYYFTENILVSVIVSIAVYALLIFAITVLPYFQNKYKTN